MCFGNSQQTQTQASTTTPAPWLTAAANSNLNFAQNLRDTGFQPYTGNQVAPFSDQQQASFGLGNGIAGAVSPNLQLAGGALANYTSAGPQSVQGDTIANNMSPYMSQYVSQALAPQLGALDQQFATQNKGFDAQATGAGAFGDTGWGLGRSNLTLNQDLARTGLIGNAYNNAFQTAIGAGAQDVANKINVGTTNANLAETALGRQLTGGNTILNQGTGAANLLNTFGGQQTAQQQAQLNAAYNQWVMAQQYPFQTLGAANQTLGAAQAGAPRTVDTTTSAPNNAGYGILGAGLGAAGASAGTWGPALMGLMSDPKLKENAKQVGELYDGTPVHSFNFKGDPRTVIGLMAPDVKKKAPEAVDESGPFQKVDYSIATRRAAKLADKVPSDGLAAQLGIAA